MRRIKVIYLIPVALVLLIGIGFAFYYLLLKPQIEAVKDAQGKWASAKSDLAKLEPSYQASLDDEGKSAQKIYEDNYRFHVIQETMPKIYDVKSTPLNELLKSTPAFKFDEKWSDDRKKLYYWYYTMATGQLIRELNGWTKGFHLKDPPEFTFSGTLGYESTLPSVKLVSIAFAQQKFKALGYPQLLKEVAAQTGYNYFPLIIDVGSTITIAVDTTDPKYTSKTPALSLDYIPTGYFFTRGWDPLGDDKTVQQTVDKAKDMILHPQKARPPRDEQTIEAQCPPVLYYYKPAGMAK